MPPHVLGKCFWNQPGNRYNLLAEKFIDTKTTVLPQQPLTPLPWPSAHFPALVPPLGPLPGHPPPLSQVRAVTPAVVSRPPLPYTCCFLLTWVARTTCVQVYAWEGLLPPASPLPQSLHDPSLSPCPTLAGLTPWPPATSRLCICTWILSILCPLSHHFVCVFVLGGHRDICP